MSQNFVGSNNINLLFPDGNFGHREKGGEDAANARYLHTYMESLTRLIFRKEDDPIYNYLTEENKLVEPEVFAPIIPMILINGAEGIGTGYRTSIPCYNPKDIVSNLIRVINEHEQYQMKPWYRGFKGKIIKKDEDDDYVFNTYGIIDTPDENTGHITELPIGFWTKDYIDFLKTIISGQKDSKKLELIDDYVDLSGNNTININLEFSGFNLQKLLKSNTLESKLKLITSI